MISSFMSPRAINATDLTIKLGHVVALNNISVSIPAGKWTTVVGPNGAGKSTLLQAFAGLLGEPKHISIFEHTLDRITPRDKARRIAWLGQNERVSGDMSVYDLVMLGRLPHLSWLESPGDHDHLMVRQALEAVHAQEWKSRSIGELSGGEQQRVFIARALAVNADILLMDEPLNNLDPPHQSDCLSLIRGLINQGKTVITVLHEIAFALYSDEIVVMKDGEIFFQGGCEDVTTHKQIEQVFQNRIEIHPFNNRLVVLPV